MAMGECSRHASSGLAWGSRCARCDADRAAEMRAQAAELRKRERIEALAEPHQWRVSEIAAITGWPWQYVEHVLTEHRRKIVQRAMAPRDLWPPSNCH